MLVGLVALGSTGALITLLSRHSTESRSDPSSAGHASGHREPARVPTDPPRGAGNAATPPHLRRKIDALWLSWNATGFRELMLQRGFDLRLRQPGNIGQFPAEWPVSGDLPPFRRAVRELNDVAWADSTAFLAIVDLLVEEANEELVSLVSAYLQSGESSCRPGSNVDCDGVRNLAQRLRSGTGPYATSVILRGLAALAFREPLADAVSSDVIADWYRANHAGLTPADRVSADGTILALRSGSPRLLELLREQAEDPQRAPNVQPGFCESANRARRRTMRPALPHGSSAATRRNSGWRRQWG
jgi:hypothetical protein